MAENIEKSELYVQVPIYIYVYTACKKMNVEKLNLTSIRIKIKKNFPYGALCPAKIVKG